MIASTVGNGAVSYLNYAERVNQLPLGVVGVAIGTALLPLLSRQLRTGDTAAAVESQNRAMEMGLLVTLPATAALITIARPIVAVLFERGSFTPTDSAAVAPALMLLAAGLPAYVLIKVLTPAFFARHDTRTPVRIAGLSMVVNVVLNLSLVGWLSYLGMALSTAVSAWLNVVLLAVILHRRRFFTMDRRLALRLPRIVFASLLMAAVLWGAARWLGPYLATAGLRWGALGLLVAGGLVAYGLAALLTGATRWSDLKGIRRRPGNAVPVPEEPAAEID
jgi:putative peptidoglycan lipid II flippase